jgi:hypothetical protein
MHHKTRKKEIRSPNYSCSRKTVVGKLYEFMLGKTVNPKCVDLGNPIVQVYIGKTPIPNTLIGYLGVTINIMTI